MDLNISLYFLRSMVYDPQEDSILLEKYVKRYSKGIVLDMGAGTGIQARAAAIKADFVIAVDIDPEAVAYCNEHLKSPRICVVRSDLFSFFREKEIVFQDGSIKGVEERKEGNRFGLIIFNAPYLPTDEEDKDIALDGGKEGFELIERFLAEAKEFLARDGSILLIFSSLSGKEKIDQAIKEKRYKSVPLQKIHISFEDIFCYRIFHD